MLLKHYWNAYQGYRVWKRIDQKYHAPIYILIPKEKEEYNYYALKHLEQFLLMKKVSKAVVLTCDEGAIASVDLFVPKGMVESEYLSRKEILRFLKYYALHEFTSRLTIVSFTEPYNTHAENLLGVNGVTKEDLVCFDVYRFGETPKKESVVYAGDDARIIAFLKDRM